MPSYSQEIISNKEILDIIAKCTKEQLSKISEYEIKEYKVKIVNIQSEKLDDLQFIPLFTSNIHIVQENYIDGKPDIFIIAACVVKTLLSRKPVEYDIRGKLTSDLFFINFEIALNVAFEIIKTNPFVYRLDENGDTYELYKLNSIDEIVVPQGYISEEPIRNRILNGILTRYLYGREFDELMFSNILHMIYVYSSKKV